MNENRSNSFIKKNLFNIIILVSLAFMFFFGLKTYNEKDSVARFEAVKIHPLIGENNPYGIEKLLYEAEVIRYGGINTETDGLPSSPVKWCRVSTYSLNSSYFSTNTDLFYRELSYKLQEVYKKIPIESKYNIENISMLKRYGWINISELNKYKIEKNYNDNSLFDRIDFCMKISSSHKIVLSDYRNFADDRPPQKQYIKIERLYPFVSAHSDSEYVDLLSDKSTYMHIIYAPCKSCDHGNADENYRVLFINRDSRKMIIISYYVFNDLYGGW